MPETHAQITRLVLALVMAAVCRGGAEELLWYASKGSVVCEGLPARVREVRVRDAQGRVVFRSPVEGPRAVVPVDACGGTLPNGSYRAELADDGGICCSHDFVHTNYPWFNTSVGKADVLLPGFTPLKAMGTSVEPVGRRYVFGRFGMAEEIWSLDEQILARPIALTLKTPVRFKLPSFKTLKATDTEVSFRSGLWRGRVEQDGLIVATLSLPETEGPVSLDIPIKKEYAQFFHAVGDAIRCNPAGKVPAGTGASSAVVR